MVDKVGIIYIRCDPHVSIHNHRRLSVGAYLVTLVSLVGQFTRYSRCPFIRISLINSLFSNLLIYQILLDRHDSSDGWLELRLLESSHGLLSFVLVLTLVILLILLLAKHLLEFVLVLLPEDTSPFLPLCDQVVRGGQVVEFVPLDVLLAPFRVYLIVTHQNLKNVLIHRYHVLAHDDPVLFGR